MVRRLKSLWVTLVVICAGLPTLPRWSFKPGATSSTRIE